MLDALHGMKAVWLRPGYAFGGCRYFVNPAVRRVHSGDPLAALAAYLDDWPDCPY